MPRFSIIIPVYNCEKYLKQCIESIINQSYNDWELILINDGSTDSSYDICKQYVSDKVRLIDKSNEGVAIARKYGVDIARGEYITFVDSDDYLIENTLLMINDIINANNVDIVRFGCLLQFSNGNVIKKMSRFNGLYTKKMIQDEIFPLLIHNEKAEYFAASLWGGVYKQEYIKPYMIENSKATIGEDSACLIPAVYNATSIYFFNEALYFYRYNSISATKGRKVFNWDNPEIVANHISKHIDLKVFDLQQQLSRRIVHDVFNVCVTRFYQNKSYLKVSKEIRIELNRPVYKNAVSEASYRHSFIACLMKLCIKYRLTLPIYFYSKLK